MDIQSPSSGFFELIPHEVTVSIFQNLDPSYRGTLSCVCKVWNEIVNNQSLCRNWKKNYMVQGEGICCKVEDYTGLVHIEVGRKDSSVSNTWVYGRGYNLFERVPVLKVKIGSHVLCSDRKHALPSDGITTEGSEFVYYRYSDSLRFKLIAPQTIEIYSHDTFDDQESRVYVDTSADYRYLVHKTLDLFPINVEEGISYFVCDFIPREISESEAQERFDVFVADVSLSEYRCIYNRFGLVVENIGEKGYQMFLSRPSDESFEEIKIDPKFLPYSKESIRHITTKNVTFSGLDYGYYEGGSFKLIVVNYASEESDKEIIVHLEGEEATTLVQTKGFTVPYRIIK
ncbi:MAG: hypothetical protein K940chlam3_00012 [Chlamydiae bacterium]|nr:hypothetical protein [Chlamydiota bacterium]